MLVPLFVSTSFIVDVFRMKVSYVSFVKSVADCWIIASFLSKALHFSVSASIALNET